MRKFKVYVEGQPFEVVVEEIKDQATTPENAAPPLKAPAVLVPAQSEGGVEIPAPMPGSVLDIKVKVGDNVNEGDILLLLEAMKMENEVVSPTSGVVIAINVAVGDSINTGDIMMTIE